jgi:RNA polymerase sigma-70 factor (ECF subfamily)
VEETGDGAIIHAVLCGHTHRFEELVRRYERPLFRVAISRLHDRGAAEDVVQETMLNAFKSLHTYDSQYNFRTWLWTILINQCRTNHRKTLTPDGRQQRTVNELDRVADQYVDRELDPVQFAINNEQSRLLESRLADLPDQEAHALRLRFFGGLKFQEIADVMQYSLSTAKNHVRQGLTRMTESMQANPNSVHESTER